MKISRLPLRLIIGIVAGLVIVIAAILVIVALSQDDRTFTDANVKPAVPFNDIHANNIDIVVRHCRLSNAAATAVSSALNRQGEKAALTIDPATIATTGDETGVRCGFSMTDTAGTVYYAVYAYRNDLYPGRTIVYAADRQTVIATYSDSTGQSNQ